MSWEKLEGIGNSAINGSLRVLKFRVGQILFRKSKSFSLVCMSRAYIYIYEAVLTSVL